jgi:tRNA-specific 2-thiouridylase
VSHIALKDVNWIGEAVAAEDDLDGRDILVRVRSTRPPVPAKLSIGAGWSVALDEPEEGVAPGQAAVFYDTSSSRVLGGGWIAATER